MVSAEAIDSEILAGRSSYEVLMAADLNSDTISIL